MRPSTAGQKKYDPQSARQIWKKLQVKFSNPINPKAQNKQQKRNLLPQNTTVMKQSKKKNTSIFERNPNMKKTTLSNNFFSTKQLGKQNNSDKNIALINKIRTEIQIKIQPKFLPYRQQTMSIIKNSKILTDNEQGSIKQYCSVALHPHNTKQYKQTDHVKDNVKQGKRHQLKPKQKLKTHLEKQKKKITNKSHFQFKNGKILIKKKKSLFFNGRTKKAK